MSGNTRIPPASPARSSETANGAVRWLPWLLATVVALAYVSSFGGVFVFDDIQAILENPTFASGWRLDRLIFYPGEQAGTLGGRPVANLTLALNHFAGGTSPWGYHLFNLAVHAAAVLALYALLRRTFLRPALAPRFGADGPWLAAGVALLWGLHPLQTESVTYVVQRVESLGGLWILLGLSCFVRSVETPSIRRWGAAAVTCAWLGVATKETVFALPLLALLYDRALCAANWREVWARRGRLHAALLGSWLLLAALVLGTGGRGGSAGFGAEVSPWSYLLTQAYAVTHYIRLAVWPSPLVFDYGTWLAPGFGAVALQFLALAAAAGATAWSVARRPLWALPAAWFFLILGPSSSIVPIATQTMAEHRMYLPLAALVLALVLTLHRWGGRRALLALLPLAVAAAVATHARNLVYHDELALWTATAEARPGNSRAHTTLGVMTAARGDDAVAVGHFERALALAPDNAPTHLNLSGSLLKLGRIDEAVHHGAEAVRLDPGNANARVNLANALVAARRFPDAFPHYEAALRTEPDAEDVHLNVASAYRQSGDAAGAVRHYTTAARINPARARTWLDLAQSALEAGDRTGAARAAAEAHRLAPDDIETIFLLGNLAASSEDLVTALRYFRRAVTLAPDFVPARNNLANALLMMGRPDEAIDHYREILRREPGNRRVQENLAHALEMQRARRTP